MSRPPLQADPRFWVATLILGVTTLALAVYSQTGRVAFAALSVVCHLELVAIGVRLARTRRRR